MQFNVASLLKEPTGSTREYDIDDDLRVDGATHHVTGHVRFDRTSLGILVRGSIHGAMSAECSRCLTPLEYPVDFIIEEEYIPSIDVNNGVKVEATEGYEDAYRITARHVLDLSGPAAEYWSTALPMAPVCRDDCPGLCLRCGADLRSGTHVCQADAADARWTKLRDLNLG
ncbi:MAG: DUF177 domain-containing protein [Chloroflexi bacterium]|nr:DUF177 domain-containing protein [Chloroflexota bacterium]